jgi:hypothetical protein
MKTITLLRLLLGLCPFIFAQQHYFAGSAAGSNQNTVSGNAFVGHSAGSSTWVASGSKPAPDVVTFADGLEVI